jgi:adenylate kinase
MATYIVLLGPPGVGKGTQAEILAEQTGLVHVSSGELFRENIKNKTELGTLAESFIHKGELVPDDLTIAMVKDRILRPDCETGAILDGFPRTPVQAEATIAMLSEIGQKLTAVPYIIVPPEVIIERLSGRWTCREAGHIFHFKFNPPTQKGVCDVDGSELYQRDDDKIETVKHRIQVYIDRTSPLVEYYRSQGLLVEVRGDQAIEKVTQDLLDALKK